MSARYLLRFDDLCPTMNWKVWDRVEEALISSGARPLMAVVPDNQDEFLVIDKARDDFWARVRAWQERGWTIGVHGFQHTHITDDEGLVGINRRSEFAGLTLAEQERKLRSANQIFEREGVRAEVWVAPFCSFDDTTVTALGSVGIGVISDGLWIHPHADGNGVVWIPHQIWRFRRMPFGVWTVGCHHNRWTEEQLQAFVRDLAAYRERLVDVPAIIEEYADRKRRWSDRVASRAILAMILAKRRARENGLMKVPADAY